jgi:hypothetical protein
MRPCGLGLWVILAAAFVIGAEARSSSVLSTQSSTEVDISDFKPSEDAPRERKRLKDRGLVEGENVGDAIFITAETEPGREEGTHTGRNPKKLKHRRLHAVEFEERRLRENDYVTPAGDFDVEGALRLAKAEQDRAKGNQHRKFYSLEQLDRMYRTSEGDVRLGIAPAPTQENITVAIKRDRWARRSHLVDMGTPGKMQSAIPKEMLKYRTPSEEIVVFVDGSVGHRYAITIEDDATVRELKEKVWVEERHARWELCGLRDKDAAKGFNIEEQALLLRGLPLDSDARMLGRFNITTYTILRVVPPLTPYNETELADLGLLPF